MWGFFYIEFAYLISSGHQHFYLMNMMFDMCVFLVENELNTTDENKKYARFIQNQNNNNVTLITNLKQKYEIYT